MLLSLTIYLNRQNWSSQSLAQLTALDIPWTLLSTTWRRVCYHRCLKLCLTYHLIITVWWLSQFPKGTLYGNVRNGSQELKSGILTVAYYPFHAAENAAAVLASDWLYFSTHGRKYNHGRWDTIVSSIRSLTETKYFKPLSMSVDLYSRSLISHMNGLKPHLQACSMRFVRKPFCFVLKSCPIPPFVSA